MSSHNTYLQALFLQIENVFGPQLLNIEFGHEELEEEVCLLLDKIRCEQADVEDQLPAIWRELHKKLRKKDPSVSDEERKLAVSLVFDCAIVLLSNSNDTFYNFEITSCLHDADAENNEIDCDNRIRKVLDVMESFADEVSLWVDNYMEQTSGNEQTPELEDKSPLDQYILLFSRKADILTCLHQLVKSQITPKDQLAPIKAAMEYKPKMLADTITVDVINQEFGLNISEDTFKNWIKGNRGYQYTQDEILSYHEIFDDQIMHKV